MRPHLLTIALLTAAVSLAQTAPPDDPNARSRTINEQVETLWPKHELYDQWKKLDDQERALKDKYYAEERALARKYSDDINASKDKRNAELRPIEEKLKALYESPAYKAYREERQKLLDQRDALWKVELQKTADLAKALYAARHDEVHKAAVPDIPNAKALNFDLFSFPKLDGSTTTQPLNTILAARFLDIPYQWFYPKPEGSIYDQDRHKDPDIPRSISDLTIPDYDAQKYDPFTDHPIKDFMLPSSHVMAAPPEGAPFAQRRIATLINGYLARNTSSNQSYINLIRGDADLVTNARLPSESEKKLASKDSYLVEWGVIPKEGVKLVCVPIAKDALVFIVNKDNPVKNLALEQIRDIYRDRYRTWEDLAAGKKSEPLAKDADRPENAIYPYWRERDSGSRELFDDLVGTLPEPKRHHELYIRTMRGVFNTLHTNELGLAYSVYYFEHFQALSPLTRTISINGIAPTAETIANGTYPLISYVYAAHRESDPPNSPARKLLQYLPSEEGQALIKESGYVPLK
ncbi:MAG: substrate-binding domain-containing protein [Phycisphaerales bacterium]|nr:substrate-binding domain-containing protein [Phycisphaerales bacterium]